MEHTRLTGSQYVGTPVSVGRCRGVLGTPTPFPGFADITAECLKQQVKVLDNQLDEVKRMFIRNCPNSDIPLTFHSKTIDKWTACEVQEILNKYRSEKSLKFREKSQCEENVNEMHVNSSPKVEQDPLSSKCIWLWKR